MKKLTVWYFHSPHSGQFRQWVSVCFVMLSQYWNSVDFSTTLKSIEISSLKKWFWIIFKKMTGPSCYVLSIKTCLKNEENIKGSLWSVRRELIHVHISIVIDIVTTWTVLLIRLFQYFRWAHTPKPYRIKGTNGVEIAHRRVQDQPLIIDPTYHGEFDMDTPRTGSTGSKKRYNMRKLSELPLHLIEANMWNDAERVRKMENR